MLDKWATNFGYVVTRDGSDVWETSRPGPPADSADVESGDWTWPGAAQLLDVFRALDAAGLDLTGADLTCTPTAERGGEGGGGVGARLGVGVLLPGENWVESDPLCWRLGNTEDGRVAWQNDGITALGSSDWPSEGVLTGGGEAVLRSFSA